MKKQVKKEEKYFVYLENIPWLKDGIYADTNVSIEILMYIQIFILMKAAFFLEGIQQQSLIIKKQTNKARHVLWWN